MAIVWTGKPSGWKVKTDLCSDDQVDRHRLATQNWASDGADLYPAGWRWRAVPQTAAIWSGQLWRQTGHTAGGCVDVMLVGGVEVGVKFGTLGWWLLTCRSLWVLVGGVERVKFHTLWMGVLICKSVWVHSEILRSWWALLLLCRSAWMFVGDKVKGGEIPHFVGGHDCWCADLPVCLYGLVGGITQFMDGCDCVDVEVWLSVCRRLWKGEISHFAGGCECDCVSMQVCLSACWRDEKGEISHFAGGC